MRLLFVTDLHGGNLVFRKTLRIFRALEADILLVGGDVVGKYLVPIVTEAGRWIVRETDKTLEFHREDEALFYIKHIAEVGGYGVICSAEERERLRSDDDYREEVLKRERVHRLREWLRDARDQFSPGSFFLNLGNDDPFYLDEVVEDSLGMEILEHRTVSLAEGFRIISCGYTNPTPWNCPRDCSEEELWARLKRKFESCNDRRRIIANFHSPPVFSHLDLAPRLDESLRPLIGVNGVEYVHVGSTAIRKALEEYSPAVGLHGHIHEAYAKERIGDTICANPGSSYHTGGLRAVLVHLRDEHVEGVQLVQEK
jgi:Icc-related predicted phosphoesterase